MKRFLSVILSLSILLSFFTFVSCFEDGNPTHLETPQNVAVSETGLVTWDAVANATDYIVVVNGDEQPSVQTNSYQLQSLVNDATITVYAVADGYISSQISQAVDFVGQGVKPTPTKPVVSISANSEVKSGKTTTVKAIIEKVENATVTWSITSGKDYATITADENDSTKAVITANNVDGDKIIKIRATAKTTDGASAYSEKVLNVVAKTVLTQDMLDALTLTDNIAYEGFISLTWSEYGLSNKQIGSQASTIKTIMGTDDVGTTTWYAKYENASSLTTGELFYQKGTDGNVKERILNLKNQASAYPVTDDNGDAITWEKSGLYNNFRKLSQDGIKLTPSDFVFDEDSWRYYYNPTDSSKPTAKQLTEKIVASANPYDFVVDDSFSLLIDDGEIIGLYAKSGADYTIVSGYSTIQEMFVAIDTGDAVQVPTFKVFSTKDEHKELKTAIANMQALTSYTLDYRTVQASVYTSTASQDGFTEIINDTDCYFRDYSVSYDDESNIVRTYDADGKYYGYHKYSDTLYNGYNYNPTEKTIVPSRAYNADFSNAKPSFAFAAEIFTKDSTYESEDGSIKYLVDSSMCYVATTLYYGLGNDIALYGQYASTGVYGNVEQPYVIVKDGYIVEATFYYYLGYLYGFAYLTYSNFNDAEQNVLPSEVSTTLTNSTAKQVPASWSELTVIIEGEKTSSTEVVAEKTQSFDAYWTELFGSADAVPFFGQDDVLGDSFGFAMANYGHSCSSKDDDGKVLASFGTMLYYDVPLDIDYSITSSITAIENLLLSNGFTKTKWGEYLKGDILVSAIDNNLDLNIYVWKVGTKTIG